MRYKSPLPQRTKYCNNAYGHVVLTNLSSIFSNLKGGSLESISDKWFFVECTHRSRRPFEASRLQVRLYCNLFAVFLKIHF